MTSKIDDKIDSALKRISTYKYILGSLATFATVAYIVAGILLQTTPIISILISLSIALIYFFFYNSIVNKITTFLFMLLFIVFILAGMVGMGLPKIAFLLPILITGIFGGLGAEISKFERIIKKSQK